MLVGPTLNNLYNPSLRRKPPTKARNEIDTARAGQTPLLEAKSLFCERDERVLFEDLSFTLSEGQITQIEGPNGSGKTTLMRMLCGLSSAYEGEIFWRGEPMNARREWFCREHVYFGHLTGIKAPMSAGENLRWMVQCMGLPLKGEALSDAIDRALHKVGLHGFEDAPVYTLSAGQKRRVALARLFIEHIPLWVLDEPFTAIDKAGVAELEAMIADHAEQGGAVLLTTHHELNIDQHRLNVVSLAPPVGEHHD